jgi:predicted metal-dependent phosphotriesterase family hydrolase
MNIVCATGFYKEPRRLALPFPSRVRRRHRGGSPAALTEVEDGIGSTGISRSHQMRHRRGSIKPYEESLLRAAAQQRRPACRSSPHRPRLARRQAARIFLAEGGSNRFAIGHSDVPTSRITPASSTRARSSRSTASASDPLPNKLRIASLIALLGIGYRSRC